MLRELHISNLAVISDVRIELDAGLNCFTGATGAGKSLVIGAVEVLLGMRSPAEMLRPGLDEGRVSGVFEVKSAETLRRIEQLTDSPVTQDGGEILLVRRLYASGRSSATLNGNPITLGMLKQVGEALVDVHGQHDHQYLLKPSNQIDVLDQFGGHLDLRLQYHEVYHAKIAGGEECECEAALDQPHPSPATARALPLPGRRDRRRTARSGGIPGTGKGGCSSVPLVEPREAQEGRRGDACSAI